MTERATTGGVRAAFYRALARASYPRAGQGPDAPCSRHGRRSPASLAAGHGGPLENGLGTMLGAVGGMRRHLRAGLAAGALALATFLGAGPACAVGTPALIVDVDTGKVIYAQHATDPWFPASVTKLMTVYVALDLVRQGKASLDQLITISPSAAAEPPSKMGFKPGSQLTLDNAMKIIMVKSANDVAYAIGENLGGSIEGFAGLMNEAAAKIGMRESRWFNPNGLPDDRQWTSARDMATLARALMRDFPGSRDLFSISAIQFGRIVMPNHNGLLGRYAGVDGMKTGFICAGGFNVVASATRGGRRLITVVMGQTTARERDLKTADLLDYGFGQGAPLFGGQTLADLSPSALDAPPNMRPLVCDRRKAPPADDDGAVSATTADGTNAQLAGAAAGSEALALASLNGASLKGRTLPPRAPLQPVLVWLGRDPAESAVAADTPTPTPAPRRLAGRKGKAGSEAAAVAETAAKSVAAKAAAAKSGVPKVRLLARPRPAVPAAHATAYAPVKTTPVIDAAHSGRAEAKAGRKPATAHGAKAEPKAAAAPKAAEHKPAKGAAKKAEAHKPAPKRKAAAGE
jgi:D-alanyl-D-alanine carboxypeptidase